MGLGSTPAITLGGQPQGRLLGTVPECPLGAFLENAEARGGEMVPHTSCHPGTQGPRELGAPNSRFMKQCWPPKAVGRQEGLYARRAPRTVVGT